MLPKIEPCILSRLPNIDRREYPFPVAINDLVFLHGFKLRRKMKETKFVPIVLTDNKGMNKFGVSLIFYESLQDYLSIIPVPERKSFHRRDVSLGHVVQLEGLKHNTEDDPMFVLNSSMIQIVPDYIDQCEYNDSQKVKILNGK